MSTDRVNDLTCEHVTGGARPEVVMGCQDRMVRVLQGSDLLFEQAMDGPVLTLQKYHNPQIGKAEVGQGSGFGPSSPDKRAAAAAARYHANDGSFKEMVYGTENGQLGLLLLNNKLMRRGWVVDPVLEGRRAKSGGVQCIATADISHDGIKDLIIGRDDGQVTACSLHTTSRLSCTTLCARPATPLKPPRHSSEAPLLTTPLHTTPLHTAPPSHTCS